MERRLLYLLMISFFTLTSAMEHEVKKQEEMSNERKEATHEEIMSSGLRTPLVLVGISLAAFAGYQYWKRKNEEELVTKEYLDAIVQGYIPYDIRSHFCFIATALNPEKAQAFKSSLARPAFKKTDPAEILQSVDYVLTLTYRSTFQNVMSLDRFYKMQRDLSRYRRLLTEFISSIGGAQVGALRPQPAALVNEDNDDLNQTDLKREIDEYSDAEL